MDHPASAYDKPSTSLFNSWYTKSESFKPLLQHLSTSLNEDKAQVSLIWHQEGRITTPKKVYIGE